MIVLKIKHRSDLAQNRLNTDKLNFSVLRTLGAFFSSGTTCCAQAGHAVIRVNLPRSRRFWWSKKSHPFSHKKANLTRNADAESPAGLNTHPAGGEARDFFFGRCHHKPIWNCILAGASLRFLFRKSLIRIFLC